LDVASHNLFNYIVSFLRELLRHYQENLLDVPFAAALAASLFSQLPMTSSKGGRGSSGGGGGGRVAAASGGGGGGGGAGGGGGGVRPIRVVGGMGGVGFDGGARGGGGDVSMVFEQLCLAMRYFLEYDGTSGTDAVRQIAAEAAAE
jgi:hypothetical protein